MALNTSKPCSSNKQIGVFDAGPGGLVVVKYMMELLPAEDLLYLGEKARQPYGFQASSGSAFGAWN